MAKPHNPKSTLDSTSTEELKKEIRAISSLKFTQPSHFPQQDARPFIIRTCCHASPLQGGWASIGIGRGLRGDEGGNVLVEVILVAAERRGGARDGGEGCGVGEDGVQVADWVVVSYRPCQRLYRASSGRK